ncbi:MAG: polysaccharide pyruvyl transferase family protein [Lactobacillaceae bacterium]|nr:polysaccharide pyruvyl transferase family protein [Lactobacillaceae bacterium]
MLEELGAHVEFVDYHPGQTLIASNNTNGLLRKTEKALQSLLIDTSVKNKINFINFKRNYAKKYLSILGIKEIYNYSPQLDLLIIGSDEVFNCVQSNPNVGFSADLFAQNQPAKRIVSYAASFGNTTYEKLENVGVNKKIESWMKSFDKISVRDKNSQAIIKKMIGRSPSRHLDPVLAYDFLQKEKFPTVDNTLPYLLLYGYSGRFSKDECTEISKFADKHNLTVLCIGGIQNGGPNFQFVDCSPLDVITYFKSAQYVITDTFHGTILSVITHKPFATLVRQSGYGNAEKVLDLLEILGLKQQQLLSLKDISTVMFNEINYSAVDQVIQLERKRTYEYLKGELSNVY